MNPTRLLSFLAHLLLGAVGGFVALALGLPMPFLLGSLTAVAPLVIWQSATERATLKFSPKLRLAFVAVIGTMIGARFTPELVAKLPTIWVSLLAVAGFVILAHLLGYAVYRRLAGYDRVTALYGSMPGGLIEGVALGEKAGGDLVLLTVHHFARIVVVVFTVPLLFAIVSGDIVGSAGGATLAAAEAGAVDLALIAALSLLGLAAGLKVKLPAGHLMGPLILAAIVHGLGWVTVESPFWLLALAQLMVGTALATQFAGATPGVLARAFGYTALAVLGMFVIAGAFAWGMTRATVMSFEAAFISFAPGGVAEMGLIALSLDASPVLVAAHHLVRIVLTVIFVRLADRALRG
ncbi:MAG: AbrB family transcriptional regulator [Pseudomonadota bacterium]